MGEPSLPSTSYKGRSGRDIGARGQRFAGARDGLDLGRFELGEALAPPHLVPLNAQHLRHGPIAWRLHA